MEALLRSQASENQVLCIKTNNQINVLWRGALVSENYLVVEFRHIYHSLGPIQADFNLPFQDSGYNLYSCHCSF